MDVQKEAKNLIDQSKNIYVVPQKNNEESVACSLALFYTLKELNKNVNLVIEDFPDKIKFLIPSLDYISYPRNFVISLPNAKADISQIHYEKDDNNLKIHLTIDKGSIKKNDISFYFAEPKADILLTVGIKDQKEMELSEISTPNTQILNIDNQQDNLNFGKINILNTTKTLSEVVLEFVKTLGESIIKKDAATALLTGLIAKSDNLTSHTSAEMLEAAAFLIKTGAQREQVVENLYK